MTTTTPPTIAITMGRSGWDWSRDHRLIRCSDDTEIVRLEDFVDLLLLHREVASRAFGSNQGCARLRLPAKFRVWPPLCHNLHIPNCAPGRVVSGTQQAERREKSEATPVP
jgi:hypothetical protein